MKRRDFLKTTVMSGAVVGPNVWWSRADAAEVDGQRRSSNAARLPRRPYGKTGIDLSIIGFPGFALNAYEQEKVKRLVAEAVERGVNYFDVAPTYGDAEQRLGPALEPYRKDVFLACKTGKRTGDEAAAELKVSLERLHTDHFDLYQLHGITDVKKDVDVAFAKGGAMEAFIEAKKAGLVRFLGFSAHSVEAAMAAMDRYDFDSVLFPVNFACFFKGNFGPKVIAVAEKKGVARLALKAMARQQWLSKDDPRRKKFHRCWYEPITDRTEAEQSLRFTLSQSVTAAIPPAAPSLFPVAVDLAMNFKPISEKATSQLKSLATTLTPIFARA